MLLESIFSHHDEARTAIVLAVGALTPFLLRCLGDMTISVVLRKCCNMTKAEAKEHLIGRGIAELSISNLMTGFKTWTEARDQAGMNTCAALTLSTMRLVFWHWLQPLLYWFILYAYWDLLDEGQHIFGSIVAVRELIYVFITLLGLCLNPTFLMIDMKASWSEDRISVFLYIIAPEKYVFLCIRSKEYCYDSCLYGILALLSIMDMCGVVALVWSLAVENVYLAMITGYCITAIGGFLIFMICCRLCLVGSNNTSPNEYYSKFDPEVGRKSGYQMQVEDRTTSARTTAAYLTVNRSSAGNNTGRENRGVTKVIEQLLNKQQFT